MKMSRLTGRVQTGRTRRLAVRIAFLSMLAVISTGTAQPLFSDNFDSVPSPIIVTNVGATNGYNFKYTASGGTFDFKAIFCFDYSTVSYPTNIPSAPHSSGTTEGLYLTVNKDVIGAVAALNLYPIGQSFSGNYSLQFDLWLHYGRIATTEHALFGINHSGLFTNQVTVEGSDGLMFAIDGDGGSSAGSATARDFSVLQGGGTPLAPVLLTFANTVFGPAPLLGLNFDNNDSGFRTNFPSLRVNGFSTTAGSAGLRWVTVQVLQKDNLITYMLNGRIVCQYTNTTTYTGGDIMLGYNDTFASVGDSNNFAIIDNILVTPLAPSIVSQPASQFITASNPVVFSVTAQSSAPLSYQWLGNGTNLTDDGRIFGSQSNVLTISSALPGDAGPYQVIVSNAY